MKRQEAQKKKLPVPETQIEKWQDASGKNPKNASPPQIATRGRLSASAFRERPKRRFHLSAESVQQIIL